MSTFDTSSSCYCSECGALLDTGLTGHHPWCSRYPSPQPFVITWEPPPPTEFGWVCPKCNRVYSPTISECWPCNSQVYTNF